MKKLIAFLCFLSLFFVSPTFAFRDLDTHSPLYPAVEYLVEKEYFPDGPFFRPTENISQELFYTIVVKDTGFDPASATFDTPLPKGISEKSPSAQYLREAIRRNFIDPENFEPLAPVTRIQAIKTLVKTKALPHLRGATNAFLFKLRGAPKSADYLAEVEAAYASKLLEEKDIQNLLPFAPLTRQDLARWLYHYEQNGEKRASLNPRGLHLNKPKSIAEEREIEKSRQTITIDLNETENYLQSRNLSDINLIPNSDIMRDIFNNVIIKYRFAEELTKEKRELMVEAAIEAMIKEVGDKFSNYVPPAKSQEFQESLEGKFEGIGAHVEMIEDDFTITAPIKNSPAMKAGILAGDIVKKVDDQDIEGWSVNDIVNLIKGPSGTKVTLTIQRETVTKEITVERAQITVPTIELTFEKGIPVISIHKFTSSTQTELEKILLQEVLPRKPRGIVIDFRNDPGGLLTAAVSMGELFTKRGQKLFSIDYKKFKQDYKSSKNGLLSDQKNIVILQNKGTASASEILVSIIRDYGLGTIIGTTTMGKGTVQEVINYNTGGILKLTVAKWLTPKGDWIQEDSENPGIKPDIEVSDPTPEEIKENVDRQLQTAIRHILDN